MMNDNENKVDICPICKREYTEHPAISRKDNETRICSKCGLAEALSEYFKSISDMK